jgi:hypothetical protein
MSQLEKAVGVKGLAPPHSSTLWKAGIMSLKEKSTDNEFEREINTIPQ